MKTAISVPDDVFRDAERFARRTRTSRSQLFSDAVREYLLRHSPDDVTAAMDRVLEEVQPQPEETRFAAVAARRSLLATDW